MLPDADTVQDLDFTQFQWAPTLGGECYLPNGLFCNLIRTRFNGHPPLGVNATTGQRTARRDLYAPVSMGTHPWG